VTARNIPAVFRLLCREKIAVKAVVKDLKGTAVLSLLLGQLPG
jgi:hypothetical protein